VRLPLNEIYVDGRLRAILNLNMWCMRETFFGDQHLRGGRRRRNRRMMVDGRSMWVVFGSRSTWSWRAGATTRATAGRRSRVPRISVVPRVRGRCEQSESVVHSAAAAARSVRHCFARQLRRDVTKYAIYWRYLKHKHTIITVLSSLSSRPIR